MSRQVGSLHRSISHPANLQNNHPIIQRFAFPTLQSPHHNTSSSIESDANSNTTINNIISQFNNSDIETPDKLTNSEPSPSTFSQPPFQPIHSQVKIEPPSPPSPISYVYDIYQRYLPESNKKTIYPNFTTQKGISKKLQLLRKGPYQIVDKPSDVTLKPTDLNRKEIVQHRNNLLTYYPKENALREITQL